MEWLTSNIVPLAAHAIDQYVQVRTAAEPAGIDLRLETIVERMIERQAPYFPFPCLPFPALVP